MPEDLSVNLSVNLNAIAYLRNRRDLPWPNLIELAQVAMQAGASGLTVHPRPDERHIKFSDLMPIRALLDDEFPNGEFNIEGYPSETFLNQAIKAQPNQITLVPDEPNQSTSSFGWDYESHYEFLTKIVARLHSHGIRVSLFTDVNANLELAKKTKAERLELYTGDYGACYDDESQAKKELEKIKVLAQRAKSLGFAINAGHDLTIENLPALCQAIPNLCEVSIGHALSADMLMHGMEKSVKLYLQALGHSH